MSDLGSVGLDCEIVGKPLMLLETYVKPSLTKSVSGVITDDTNANCARIVRLYARATGRLVGQMTSNSGTGAFSLIAPNEEVQRIVLDDSAGTLYNDLIDRVLPGP